VIEPVKAVKAPPRPRKAAAPRVRAVSTPKPVDLRWTPPEVFKPWILSLLEEAGGELEADQMFEQLEAVAAESLKPSDNETTPEGEPRWRYAARRARMALIDDGLMSKSRPGVWQLAPGEGAPGLAE
jgi:hypothetical protein